MWVIASRFLAQLAPDLVQPVREREDDAPPLLRVGEGGRAPAPDQGHPPARVGDAPRPGRERGEEAVELGEGHAAGRGTVGGEEGAERLEPRADGIDPRRAGRPPLVRGARLVPHRTAPSPRCACPGTAPIEVHLDLLPRRAGFSPDQRSVLAYSFAVPPHLCGITISHCVPRCLLN